MKFGPGLSGNLPRDAKDDPGELPDDPRLMQAVQEYMKQLEAGQAPNREEFLRGYPDLREPLAQCLDGLELVHKAAVRKKQPLSSPMTFPAGGDNMPANPLGDFQIIREIGRGGMGIVYEALQLSLGRRVALKVLPFAATFDARHLQRFQNEARAAAQLHHTNIVPVYGVGCERGVHYYAMQLIEGQSLYVLIHQIKKQESGDPGSEYRPMSGSRWQSGPGRQAGENTAIKAAKSRDQRLATGIQSGEATGPFVRSGLGPPRPEPAEETSSPLSLVLTTQRSGQHSKFFVTVAQFMVQAAEAVEHAHQLGIVHRDIKPANLLVDAHNRLWVTDFGLAQFHTDAGLTQTGDIMGTLRYMSPEQASGKKVLDHRTDVYSLGATLYELVTLEPIFPGRNRQELLHQIMNEEPRPPRSLEKTLPVELETIILKAVNKNAADRYASAQEFADDLQRFLDDKPILAKRPTMLELVRKWSRRHPSVVIAAMLVLVVCLVGLVASNWIIAQEQGKTKAALKSEKERSAQARSAVGLLVEIAEKELAHPFMFDARRKLLETALEYYQNFLDANWADVAEQADLEKGKAHVSRILDQLATLQGVKLISLAREASVQEELKLAKSQRDNLVDLDEQSNRERQKAYIASRNLPPEERRESDYKLAKQHETRLMEVLNEQQLERLKQIDRQLQGPRVFQDSTIASALKLTVDQKAKVRKIAEESLQAMLPFGDKGGGKKGGKERGPRFDRVQKAEIKKVLEVLSPEQQARWQELAGPTFEGQVTNRFFGMGPPPPRDFGGKGPPGGPKGPF
jgi:serine/threonine protein kinase